MKLSKNYKKPSWDQYFKQITKVVAGRANCRTRQTAAIMVRDKMIISTGYNGTPKGVDDCYKGGCARCNNDKIASGEALDKCICVHAEENAIIQAAYNGMSSKGTTLYTIYCPCNYCAKSIINAGVKEVVYWDRYYGLDAISKNMFKQAGVKVRRIE